MSEVNIYALMPRPYVNQIGAGVFLLMRAFDGKIRKERKRLYGLLDWLVHEAREQYRASLGTNEQDRMRNRAIDFDREWSGALYVAAHSLGLIRIEGRAVSLTDEGRRRLAISQGAWRQDA